MMIDHWKPLGGFIENTIRPLLEELHWFFEECDKRTIPLNPENVKVTMKFIADKWLLGLIVKSVQNIVLALIFGYVLCQIYQI